MTLLEDLEARAASSTCSTMYVNSIRTADGSKSTISPKDLSIKWNIGLDTARKTLLATTRLCKRNTTDISLNRRYASNDRMIRYSHLDTSIFSDTMFASARAGKSVRNYTCAQIFATDFGWIRATPLFSEKDNHLAFKELFKEVGVPKESV
jgi:hypothetical protein